MHLSIPSKGCLKVIYF